nr:hypothetical protein [Tanacetum cinerariifolium]
MQSQPQVWKLKIHHLGLPKAPSLKLKSSGKFVHVEEPQFEVGDTDMPQGQEGNQGNNNVKPRTESASRHDWFTKPSWSQEPTDPDWNE